MSSDVIIIGGMLMTCVCAISAAFAARLYLVSAGVVVSGVSICVGLAYFGWRPMFGGGHSNDTFFGCVMLFLGLLGALLFLAIDEAYRRIVAPLRQQPAFPVITPPADRR